jgi:hypothetical protein
MRLPLAFAAVALSSCDFQPKDADDDDAPDTGTVAAADGSDGADGADGTDGTDGSDGGDGTDGTSGDPCPSGVTCVSSFPYTARTTTTGAGSDRFDSYACASGTDESGPEVIFEVELPDDGFLALDLPQGSMASGADIDVHLLGSLDSADCLDRGHWRAGDYLTAGTYYVVADTWVNGSGVEQDGSFTLTLGFTSVGDLAAEGLDAAVAEKGLYAFGEAWAGGDTDGFAYAITDFSLRSDNRRQWVLDLSTGALMWKLHVAHGEGSSRSTDSRWAETFSNTDGSHQSSLGMMKAAETYTGTYGYSVRLDGLEPGYNSNARSRYIVVHPWGGSRPAYVSTYGETAPTWGCPALDDAVSTDVVDFLADGGLLFFWYPDGDWSNRSSYLP